MNGAARKLPLERIFGSKVLDDAVLSSPRWMADNRRLAYLDRYPGARRNTVWAYDAETGERRPMLDPRRLRRAKADKPLTVHAIHLSHNERHLLLTGRAPARFAPCGDLWLYDFETGRLRRLTQWDGEQYHPRFSPDDRLLAFVRDNDLWVVELETGRQERLTHDGSATRYNGRCGWVYEEELGLACSYEWSPDGRWIGFLQQDESGVPEVLLPQYEKLHGDPRRTRYPKAGDPNPTVRLGFVRPDGGEVRWADLSNATGEPAEEHYLAHLQWEPRGQELLVQYLPRLQNRLRLLAVDAETLAVREVLEERDEAWVDPPGRLHFVGETNCFLWPSERDGWRHLYVYDLEGRCHGQITRGEWEVSGVAAVDAARGLVYFQAALPEPTERNIYAVPLDGGEPVRLTEGAGVHSAVFSKDCRRYLHTHSTLNQPPRMRICTVDGDASPALNKDTLEVLRAHGVPVGTEDGGGGWELLTFRTDDGTLLYGRMLKPPDFDPGRRYPVLMHTYGGPGSQVVLNQWGGKGALWHHYLAQRGFLVFLCDNRGTGGRGRDFKKITYLRLGHWEVQDQIAGARYLQSLPYVDPKRIAIWGWSYGGYMACMLVLKGADVFRAGVAVAPVTDWTLYDTIYTERYMRKPEENAAGYREGSPVHHAKALRGKLLIVHGTMDDNVHFQNAARMASALQDAGKPFEFMLYPGRHHGIENRHLHLYRTMTLFLLRALK